jgi:hypothetical protein
VKQHANVPDPQRAVLTSALLNRLPALTDELLKRVLKQSEIDGNQSDIYGDDRLVPVDDLHQSLRDNLKFILSNLGCPGHTIWPPRGEPATRHALPQVESRLHARGIVALEALRTLPGPVDGPEADCISRRRSAR